MSISTHFYHSTLRKYIITFGTIFNGITVRRGNDPNYTYIPVPIAYGSKQKWFARLQQNPDLKRGQAVTLPRLSFVITNVMYDAERKTSSIGKMPRVDHTDNTRAKRIFHPVPYNVDIALTIYAKNMDDYLQIFEQIVPFFKPDFPVTITDINGIDVVKDLPVILNDISIIHDSEGVMDEYRVINSDLNFTLKGSFYGPINYHPLIRRVIIDTRLDTAKDKKDKDKEPDEKKTQPDTRMIFEPDPSTAFADDDYGFTETHEMYPEGDWDEDV